jgi:twinkle protein
LGQVSLDLAEQDVNVLWGSFEIKNTRLLHKLLKQFSREALPDIHGPNAVEALDALADRFEGLPLHFMRFHGGSEVDEVLDAMEYAVYVNDVEHIILDNMQFMITRNVKGGNNSTFDKFDVQDIAIEKFRKFATEHNVHLTLVVHPRKEDESSKLNISSFYGSAKATQEADTVIILQNDGRRKYIEVKKNRFDGTLGFAPLYFQSASGRYVETEGSADPKQQQQQQPSVAFNPPQPQNAWKPQQQKWPAKPKEEDIAGLDNHWIDCLRPKKA